MSEQLLNRGPCTECATPHDACTGPAYCCDECLHLDANWEGYNGCTCGHGDLPGEWHADDCPLGETPPMTTTDRSSASDASFRARVAPFEDGADAEESARVRVAKALFQHRRGPSWSWDDAHWSGWMREADAALAVMRPQRAGEER